MNIRVLLTCMVTLFFISNAFAQDGPRKITLEEFVGTACKKDTAFQKILVDELKLRYSKALALPAGDVVVEVESKYKFLFKPDEEDTENSVALTKLFPYSGTEVSAEYGASVSNSTRNVTSDITYGISQPIAQNAFGRNTRLLDEIVGVEIDVAKFQIAEAYEDYLASLISVYFEWYSAYENLRTAVNSYNENIKLLENIKQRQQNNIALPIDVNKITLQVMAKRENVITRQNEYDDYLNKAREVLRYEGEENIEPADSALYSGFEMDFEDEYKTFDENSRTSKVLTLLEQKSSLQVDKYADQLLPSINLDLSFTTTGSGHSVSDSSNDAYAGISINWPFPDEEGRAEYETSKIDMRKTQLSSDSTRVGLYTTLKNLSNQMEREKKLIEVADEKIKLAEAIVEDEKENYSLGRSTLNDLIDEVNKLEDNKFNKITHRIKLHKLVVEWRRLSDTLIKEDEVLAK